MREIEAGAPQPKAASARFDVLGLAHSHAQRAVLQFGHRLSANPRHFLRGSPDDADTLFADRSTRAARVAGLDVRDQLFRRAVLARNATRSPASDRGHNAPARPLLSDTIELRDYMILPAVGHYGRLGRAARRG